MPTPDPTAYNLILAAQYSAANDVIRAGWPQSILDLVQVSAQAAAASYQATSGTSILVGTGSKVFTLTVPHGWPAGTPVYIIADADPTAVMVGSLSIAEAAGGIITVNVTATSGSGTFSLWHILLLKQVTTVVSPPVTQAQGGTGGTDAPTARTALQTAREIVAKGSLVAPPGSPTIGDTYRVLANATGAWATHDNQIATWGGSSWAFETVTDTGPLLIDTANDRLLVWTGTKWTDITAARASSYQLIGLASGYAVDATTLTGSDFFEATSYISGGNSFSLPVTGVPAGATIVFYNNIAATSVTVNVQGGSNIDGVTTKTALTGEKWTFKRTSTQWVVVAKV